LEDLLWNFEVIEAALSEAAFDPTSWSHALDVITEETEAFGTILIPATGPSPLPNFPFSRQLGESTEAYFSGGWDLRDERRKGLPLLSKQAVFDDLDILDSEQIKQHPYYQQFLRPVGLKWFAGVHVRCNEETWILSIQRGEEQLPFSPAQKRRLANLSSLTSSAATVARALGFRQASGMLDAFDVSGLAAILLDRGGNVVRANSAAESLLVGEWTILNGRLRSTSRTATAEFDRVLGRGLFETDRSKLPSVTVLPRSGGLPLLAYLLRTPPLEGNALASCQAVIVLVDPNSRLSPSEVILRSVFKLTPAEARLACNLSSGDDLEQTAFQLGVSKETVRNQLRGIFTKTETHRQSELVALLASLSRPLLDR
jgi:DNA-binding CsgD family transcriptional regulator